MRLISIAMALFISACTATGPAFEKSDIKQATMVVYRQQGVLQFTRDFDVSINGGYECELSNGSFFVSDTLFETNVTAEKFDEPGVSRLRVFNKPHRTNYVRVEFYSPKQVAGFVGGMIGQSVMSHEGPFVLTQVPESQALEELQGLKRDCE